jgi:hypothetical protein
VNTPDDRSEDEEVSSSNLPGSATELLSRTMEPRPQYSAGGEKSAIKHTTDLTGVFRKVPWQQLEDLPPSSMRNSGSDMAGSWPASSAHAEEVVAMAAGFTQIFQSLSRSSGRRSGEDEKEPFPAEPMSRDLWQRQSSEVLSSLTNPEAHPTQAPSDGQFTRLFSNLQREGSRTAVNEQTLLRSGEAVVSQKGGFTQLLRTLSADQQDAAPSAGEQPVTSSYAASEPVSSGPGEFTRVISGSLLREAQGRTIPAAPPRMPAASSAAEITVPSPTLLHANSPGTPRQVSVPILTPEQLMTPPPAVPAGPVPPAAPVVIPANQIQQPSPPGTLQRYVPLLLIANLFVMVLLLVAVVVVFLRH